MVTSPDKYAELTALFSAGVAGDTVSYNKFLQKTLIILRRIIAKRLPNSDVEDVAQEALISVHKARHTYDGKRPLMPWLLAIMSFRVNDHLRKLYAQSYENIELDTIAEIIGNNVISPHGETESLDELLKDVPERQKRILTMMYVEGHTAKETGKQLNMKESAVKVAAHRAIRKIRERLEN